MLMLPRIEARAQLATIEAIALAMGSPEDQTRTERMEKLRAQARGELVAAEPKRTRPSAAKLADMGIGMTIVGPDGKPIGDQDHG